MKITMNMAHYHASVSRPLDTEIGTLQFRKANQGWEVANYTTGAITGCSELQVLVDMMNNQIALERYTQALGLRNAPKNYARKRGQ